MKQSRRSFLKVLAGIPLLGLVKKEVKKELEVKIVPPNKVVQLKTRDAVKAGDMLYSLGDSMVGLPLHPNCRCNILPIGMALESGRGFGKVCVELT